MILKIAAWIPIVGAFVELFRPLQSSYLSDAGHGERYVLSALYHGVALGALISVPMLCR